MTPEEINQAIEQAGAQREKLVNAAAVNREQYENAVHGIGGLDNHIQALKRALAAAIPSENTTPTDEDKAKADATLREKVKERETSIASAFGRGKRAKTA